jgi:hypothetical protein
MVGLLGCGCCGETYCDGVHIGNFTDNFQLPLLVENLPVSDYWSAPPPSTGSTLSDFIGWVKYKYKDIYSGSYPWWRVQANGKFLPFILRPPSPGGAYWARGLTDFSGNDKCVYSANYRVAKYKTEITVSLPISKAPAKQYHLLKEEDPWTGPWFVLTGPWSRELEVSSKRLFGPRICIGLRRQVGGAPPWQHYWLVLDKYTTTQDAFFSFYKGTSDNFIAPKNTYKIGIEIECTNLSDYGNAPGPVFTGRAFIDDKIVYSNTYGPFSDSPANLLGGRNNWRPNGHCRCMYAGAIHGGESLHPIAAFNPPTSFTNLFSSDVTESFWADDFTFTETYL